MAQIEAAKQLLKNAEQKVVEARKHLQELVDTEAHSLLMKADEGCGFCVINYFGVGSIEPLEKISVNTDYDTLEVLEEDFLQPYGYLEVVVKGDEETLFISGDKIRVIRKDGSLKQIISSPLM